MKFRHMLIEISFLESNDSWIYLPKQISISTSNRKKNLVFNINELQSEKIKFDIGKRIKKITFKIDNEILIPDGKPGAGHTPWTFIDEIVFN